MSEATTWHFNNADLDRALNAWAEEQHEVANPEGAESQAECVREFLNSYTALDHGLCCIVKSENS